MQGKLLVCFALIFVVCFSSVLQERSYWKDCRLSWLCDMGCTLKQAQGLHKACWISHLSQSGLPSPDASIPLALLQGKVNPSSTPHTLYLCFIFPSFWWLPVLMLHFFHAPHVVGRQMGVLTESTCNGWCGFCSCIRWRKLESLNFFPLVSPSSTVMPPKLNSLFMVFSFHLLLRTVRLGNLQFKSLSLLLRWNFILFSGVLQILSKYSLNKYMCL